MNNNGRGGGGRDFLKGCIAVGVIAAAVLSAVLIAALAMGLWPAK